MIQIRVPKKIPTSKKKKEKEEKGRNHDYHLSKNLFQTKFGENPSL